MNSPFKPAWWMRNRHAQTILPRFFRPRLAIDHQRELFSTYDDDHLELAWALPMPENNTKPLAIVLHGLEGNIDSFYAKGMMKALHIAGFDVVLMHFRNCGSTPNKLARAYHSGETSDLRFFIESLKQRFSNKPLMAVGFSLGGNVLAKYLGEYQHDSKLDAAAVISAPFALASSCEVIQKSCFKLYQKYLLDRLKNSSERKLEKIKEKVKINHQTLRNIKTLYEFDDKITAPLHDFVNAADYYLKSSAKPYLKKICAPTLVIHACDDPMLSEQATPRPHDVSPQVKLLVSERGGHVGFITGHNPLKPVFWLEQVVPNYFINQLRKS